MVTLYYPPERGDNDDDQLYAAGVALREYVDDLLDFSAEVLRKGWLKARRDHKGQTWPKPETIRACCLSELPVSSYKPAAARRSAVSYKLLGEQWLRSAAGQQALRDGVAADGCNYIDGNGEFPPESFLATNRAARVKSLEWARDPESCPAGVAAGDLFRRLLDASEARNNELRKRYLNEEVA